VDHGRWGVLLAAFLKLPVLFVMVLPGTMAIHLYPELPRPDLVYPTMMFDMLPNGLLGLVMAGFIAALMSQIDSTLNAASTLITMDFIHTRKPQLSGETLMKTGRWVTGVFMILAALWAPQIERFASLFKYLQMVLAYTVPPVAAVYLAGAFWKGANATGAWRAVLLGTAAGVVLFVLNEVAGVISLHFLYIAPILFALSIGLLAALSRRAPPAAAEQQALVWTPAFFREESAALRGTPWWQNYRWISLGLLLLTAWLVLAFA
jgi:SSS family solute:Na+ symporter